MKTGNVQNSFAERLSALRKLIAERFPRYDMQNFMDAMSSLAHYHYNKKKVFIVGESRELYDFLIANGYNPYTVYRWLLLERLPDDIRFQIKERQLSQKKAVSEAFERRHETTSSLGETIKAMGLNLIRRM